MDVYDGLLCDESISIRRLVIYQSEPLNALKYLPMKVLNTMHMTSSRRSLTSDACSEASGSSSLADMETIDNAALEIQDRLLEAYDNMAKNKTAKEAADQLFSDTGDAAHQATSDTCQAAIESLQTSIDADELLLEDYKGKFDLLWQTDTNV